MSEKQNDKQSKEDVLKFTLKNGEEVDVTKEEYEQLQNVAEIVLDKQGSKKEALSKQEVFDVMKFLDFASQNSYLGYFNPDLVNDAMVSVNTNPIKPTQQQVDKAYKDVFGTNNVLLSYGDYFELSNMLYKRVLEYFGNIASFDLEFECMNYDVDFDNQQYRADEKRLQEFLYKFNYRYEFSKIAKELYKHDSFFGALRIDNFNDRYAIQQMPTRYCRIDGRHPYGLSYSFNMDWFRQAGVDIRMYPKFLRDQYHDLYIGETDEYDPSDKLRKRDGTWIEWTQVKPNDGFWVFKFDEQQIAQIPLFSPMFRELAYQEIAEGLQNNEFLIKTSQIIMAVMETMQNSKNGQNKDNFELSDISAAAFSTLARSQVGDLAQFVATPFKDAKLFSSELNTNNVLDDYKTITSSSFGGSSRVLYSTDKLGENEAKHAINVDEILATSVYPMFANFIEYFVNKETKKYKFRIKFLGTKLNANKEARLKSAREDMAIGIQDIQTQASARGLNSFELLNRMKQTKASGWDSLIRTFATANTTSSESSGRPKKDDNDLSESGSNTRNNGGNVAKGGDA